MSWITSLFTSKAKLIDDIFDKDSGILVKTGSWIGNMNFTEEERAELDAEQVKAVQKFVVDTLSENTERSTARRDMAVHFLKFFTLLIFMAGMTYPIDPEWSKIWFDLPTSYSVAGVLTSTSVFFFGSHALTRHSESKKR